MKSSRRLAGFTLIELLVVISIIALLIGILLPALGAARSAARELKCLTQVRSFVQAGFSYEADNGVMPPVWDEQGISNNDRAQPIWSQRLHLQGYIGRDRSIEVYRCPVLAADLPNFVSTHFNVSDTDGVFTYNMNAAIGGLDADRVRPYLLTSRSSDQVREPSRTLLMGENYYPSTMLVGNGRSAAAAGVPGWMGIPHRQGDSNGATFFLREDMTAREGTNNMGFVDGSGRAVQGEQTARSTTVFELGDKLIIEDPFF